MSVLNQNFILLLSFLVSQYTVAQFSPAVQITQDPIAPAIAEFHDLDGDGDLDILSVVRTTKKIFWYQNSGSGQFGEPLLIAENVGNVQEIIAVDFNSDEIPDIVYRSKNTDEISLISNLGSGVFAPSEVLSSLEMPASFHLSDIDGDGDPDLVAASNGGAGIGYFENLGDNQLSDFQQLIEPDFVVRSIYSTDMQGDGLADIIVIPAEETEESEFIRIHFNQSSASFSETPSLLLTGYTSNEKLVYAAPPIDMDSDGDMDMVAVFDPFGEQINYYENDGNGNFTFFPQVADGWTGSQFILSDINLDGLVDIFKISSGVFPSSQRPISWFQNNGGGEFSWELDLTNDSNYPYYPRYLDVADADGDGDEDVLICSFTQRLLLLTQNSGAFDDPDNLVEARYRVTHLDFHDVDNDGMEDLLIGGLAGKITWNRNESNGLFGPPETIASGSMGLNEFVLTDINDDNSEDLIVMTKGDEEHSMRWLENNGNWEMIESETIYSHDTQILEDFYHYTFSDIDSDEDLDIIRIINDTATINNILLHRQLSDNTFAEPILLAELQEIESHYPKDIYVSDIDSDGDRDIFLYDQIQIMCVLNESGVYEEEIQLGQVENSDITRVESAEPIDIEGDGDLDVFLIIRNIQTWDNEFRVLENTGNSFSPSSSYVCDCNYSGGFSPGYELADFDTDGITDVALLCWSDGADILKVLKYTEDGNFLNTLSLHENEFTFDYTVSELLSKDYDEDGDVDLFVGTNAGTVHLMENYLSPSESYPQAGGMVYHDLNQNGLLDEGENGLGNIPVISSPAFDFYYTNVSGSFTFVGPIGESEPYLISVNPPSGWSLTTDPSAYMVYPDSFEVDQSSLNFGLASDSIFTAINSELTAGIHRCDQLTNFWIDLSNQGPTSPSLKIELRLADGLILESLSVEPDSIIGQSIYWSLDNLLPFMTSGIDLSILMPDVENVGDTLESILIVEEMDVENGVLSTFADTISYELVCAFDPNDKSVNPQGVEEEGYISVDQDLEYLIRFQNTGTDTAFTVVVKDQLSPNLDWSTFEPVSASHAVQTSLTDGGLAVFTFENILLPDSSVDFLGSQGYVKFRISPEPNLDPNTEINNNAAIFFDQNPPIFTNTVSNRIECYDSPQPVISYDGLLLSVPDDGLSYLWFFNGEPIPWSFDHELYPSALNGNGNYTVEVTYEFGCTSTSEPYFFSVTSVSNPHQVQASIYPNPFVQKTSISFDKPLAGEYDLVVYNLQGVMVKSLPRVSGQTIVFDGQNLPAGLYLACLSDRSSGHRINIGKLVIQ